MSNNAPAYVDGDGRRYLPVSEGARLIGADLICEATLSNYAMAGHHPCGLDLGVIKRPLLRTNKPRTDRQYRLMIPEDRLLLLRDLLKDFKDHRHGPMSDRALDEMRNAANKRLRFACPPSVSP